MEQGATQYKHVQREPCFSRLPRKNSRDFYFSHCSIMCPRVFIYICFIYIYLLSIFICIYIYIYTHTLSIYVHPLPGEAIQRTAFPEPHSLSLSSMLLHIVHTVCIICLTLWQVSVKPQSPLNDVPGAVEGEEAREHAVEAHAYRPHRGWTSMIFPQKKPFGRSVIQGSCKWDGTYGGGLTMSTWHLFGFKVLANMIKKPTFQSFSK